MPLAVSLFHEHIPCSTQCSTPLEGSAQARASPCLAPGPSLSWASVTTSVTCQPHHLTLPEFPMCFTATARWQATASHKYLAALQNIPHAFCSPVTPPASQVPADLPSTADLLLGYKSQEKNHINLITAARLALSLY